MCIICISEKGIRQPSTERIRTMFENNPHGAGYMLARNGRVFIHKGFMDEEEFLAQIARENFTPDDVVIYHFRISTQGGVNRELTHPFPLSSSEQYLKALDIECACGIAHNGVIPLTSASNERGMSDTALFIRDYLPHILRAPDDLKNDAVLDIIDSLIGYSRLAVLDGSGYVATVGDFIEDDDGLLYSNSTYKTSSLRKYYTQKKFHFAM